MRVFWSALAFTLLFIAGLVVTLTIWFVAGWFGYQSEFTDGCFRDYTQSVTIDHDNAVASYSVGAFDYSLTNPTENVCV